MPDSVPLPPEEADGTETELVAGGQPSGETPCHGEVGTLRVRVHRRERAFHLPAVFANLLHGGEERQGRGGRTPDPRPQFLAHRAEAEALPLLDEIDDRTVVGIIAHREKT
jgi:hypothetical protein